MYAYRLNIACVTVVVALITTSCFLDAAHGACTWTQPDYKWWSNPSSWPSNTVPANGADVVIPTGYKIVYDISTVGVIFNSITVSSGAQLVVDQTKDINLSTGYILVQPGASFKVGNATCPYTYKATLTFYGLRASTLSVNGLGNKGIICGGNLEFWGNPPQPTWTNVAATVMPNATSFIVKDNLVNWNVGDKIVLATTDFYAELSEVFKITSVVGRTVTVDKPVKYMHYGANNQYAEVGSISRNIVLQGDNVTSDSEQYGGHVLLYGNATGKVWGAEFLRMGQRNSMGRYPFHFHIMGDQVGKGHFVSENSFHDNYQRCFTVHGTSGILARNNVGWNVTGHCYFFEEGSESMNYYDHNLGISVTPGQLIPTDVTPSIFWISNPNNTFVNNAAVGGFHGFWYSLPASPLGLTSYMTNIRPQNIPMSPFFNNVAHSNQLNGLHIDDGPNANGYTDETMYFPSVNPLASPLVPLRVVISNVTSYKNRGYGIWARGNPITVDSCLLMDNKIGINLPFGGNVVSNNIIVGETPNIGTLLFTAWFNDLGRSRPLLWRNDFPIHGVEFYDINGNQYSLNNTFVNFTSNSLRQAGAVGVMAGYYILPSNVLVKQSKFVSSDVFAMEITSWDGPRHVIIQDSDGSLTGTYGNYLVSNNSILTYSGGCTQRAEYMNFYICPRNENGFVNINVMLSNVAQTNFTGSSLSASFTPFGQPKIVDSVQGVDMRFPTRSSYGVNVPSRGGYVMSFPYPTPAQLSINFRYGYKGEWAIVALSYPNTATFTITRGWYKTPVTSVNSIGGVNMMTYYYDPVQQYLYVMYMEDAVVTSSAGFPKNSIGTSNIDITASCGMNCVVPGVRPLPPALVDSEDKYRAILKGCSNANNYEGDAYVRYNPQTRSVSFVIYHNLPDAVSATIQDANTGLIYDMVAPNAPIKGSVDISWTKLNQLWNGNWSIVITTTNPQNSIRGVIGCVGSCSSPPLIPSSDPCANIAGEMKIYNDTLNPTAGWYDWSYGNVNSRNFSYAADKRCGASSIKMTYNSWDSLNFHVGDCAPGACTASWQHPTVNVSNYAFYQFNIRSPAGALPFPLSAQGSAGAVQITSKHLDNWIIENTWTRVKIPLADMGYKGYEMLGTIQLGMNGWFAPNNTFTLLFDEIKLVPAYADPITRPPSGAVKYFTGPQC